MATLRFEIWRNTTLLADTEYAAPMTRDQALAALRIENPLWVGKLTVKDNRVGLRGPTTLDASQVYVLWLAQSTGKGFPDLECTFTASCPTTPLACIASCAETCFEGEELAGVFFDSACIAWIWLLAPGPKLKVYYDGALPA